VRSSLSLSLVLKSEPRGTSVLNYQVVELCVELAAGGTGCKRVELVFSIGFARKAQSQSHRKDLKVTLYHIIYKLPKYGRQFRNGVSVYACVCVYVSVCVWAIQITVIYTATTDYHYNRE
jgi:hypothetical protein